MNISAIAIRRPVFTVMVTMGLLVLGIVGYRSLGTDLFPDVSFPVVAVTTPYPGAGPKEVETLVTRPVEDAVIGISGIDRVRTFSRESVSLSLVFFKLGVDVGSASTEVRERISAIRYKLPDDVKEPTIRRFDATGSAVLIYALAGTRSLAETRRHAVDVLKPALEQLEGVAAVEVKGGAEREIRIALDRTRLDAQRVDPLQLVQRLRAGNLTVPAGKYDEGKQEVSVRTVGEYTGVEEIRNLVVSTGKDGSVTRLRDVAQVDDAFEDRTTIVRDNGREAVSFEVFKQSGTNTVAVSDRVKARLAELERGLPEGVALSLILDQSKFIGENVDEVQLSIVFGGAMAIFIILLFMLDLRSTLISAVALPTSVVSTFFFMDLLGYSLNMMTLLGLSLAIGLLIDDAVVVRENIFKHLERGKSPAQAALDGTKEIALSVLSTTLTIVAVFVPVAFVKGMVGQFFRQFGITVAVAVMLSLFVAFTLDPMLSARFSKPLGGRDRFARLKAPIRKVLDGIDGLYRAMLGWTVRHKLVVLLGAVGSLFGMGYLAGLTGVEFLSAEDRGQYMVEIEFPAGTSLAETERLSTAAAERLRAHPEVRLVFATIGLDGAANKTRWRVLTSPKQERTLDLEGLKQMARDATADLVGAKIVIADPPIVEGAATEAPIIVDVRGNSYEEVNPVAAGVADILRTTPGVAEVQVKYSPGRPELRVEVNRQRAAELGIEVAQVAMALRTALEGGEAGSLRDGKDEIPIRVRYAADFRATSDALARVTLNTPRGPVKLSDVARFERGEGPQVIERENRSRQVQVWATPRGRALGDVLAEFAPRVAALAKPEGTSIVYDGQIRLMGETNENMLLALLLGVVFIYLVLASQFESFIHPLTIMLTLPLALVGAILALFLSHNTIAMGSLIGIILLMGLVTKNAILLIDRAIVRVRERGDTPLVAILAAGPERLRPILMTSAAMVLGMLPTAIGRGEGSEFRAPMAIAVIGGVVSSTLLSLLVVPAFYLTIEGMKATLRRWRGLPATSRRLAAPAE
ncbi:MAG: efflux RND transporter permease subunit [Myxococcales bacterium]|nr:efflux RND transporter permease subunit [Myxococcales bacterium]